MDESLSPLPVAGSVSLINDWNEFRSTGDASVRGKLIDSYLPFARMLAAKSFARRTYPDLEFQDYLQYAIIGLVESIDRFDPAGGAKFETFSEFRITGAILNGIGSFSDKQRQVSARKRIMTARVESLKSPKSSIDTSTDALFGYLAEIAVGLAIGFALEDSGMYQAEVEPSYTDNTYRSVEMSQLRKRILLLIGTLPRIERSVINYHYLQHLAFVEIAVILGVTKGRVSQIHREALKRLKTSIKSDGSVDLSF